MSPEQVAGERNLDARSDIYSLACVLYEMLAGQPPFTAATAQAVLARHVTDTVPPITTVRSSVPPPVAAAIGKALGKAPVDRFESAKAFSEALFAETVDAGPEVESIVVLPFENLSPDPDNAFFADGLTEEIIADLSKLRTMRVISRTSAMAFKGTGKTVPTIGQELNVRYALEGSVRRAGNSLRITAQLIDCDSDAHLWAERYSGTLDDVFEIQESLARKIVDQLRISLSPDESSRLAKRRITSPFAYECHLRAKQHLTEFTSEGYDRAIDLLTTALEIEGPNECLYTTMGLAHVHHLQFGVRSDEAFIQEAKGWADKAFGVNPESAGGHAVLGWVLLYQGRMQEAVAEFKVALRSEPDNSDALVGLVMIAEYTGHVDTARSYFQRLAAIDPMSEGLNPARSSYYSGEFENAVEPYRLEWKIDPDNPTTRWAHGVTLAWAGHIQEACEILEKVVEDSPDTSKGMFARFCVAALQGDRDRALAAMTPDLELLAGRDIQFSLMIGSCYAMLGLVSDAVSWLRQAMHRGFINYPFLAERDPFLAGIRSHPKFQELMKEIKGRWEAFEP
jgi:TolB-like protein/Tfp pilus assembly protein PilF